MRFIEKFGLLFEDAGGSRTLGRVFGYLLLAEEPRTLDQVSSDLLFSKATASLTIRQGLSMRLFEKVSRTGQRKDCYQVNMNSWVEAMMRKIDVLEEWDRMLEHGLSIVSASNESARENLEWMKDYLEFCLWYMSDMNEFYDRWKKGEIADS